MRHARHPLLSLFAVAGLAGCINALSPTEGPALAQKADETKAIPWGPSDDPNIFAGDLK